MSVQAVMPEEDMLLRTGFDSDSDSDSAASTEERTSNTRIGRGLSVFGVLAGVLTVVTLGAAPMLLATGTHLRNTAKEPLMQQEIVDAIQQKFTRRRSNDCSQTGCWEPGHWCYKKDEYYAGCRASCTPGGIHLHDPPEHRTPWSCEVINHKKRILKYNCVKEDGKPCQYSEVELVVTDHTNVKLVGGKFNEADYALSGEMKVENDCFGWCGTIKLKISNYCCYSTLSGTWQTGGKGMDDGIYVRWTSKDNWGRGHTTRLVVNERVTWNPIA